MLNRFVGTSVTIVCFASTAAAAQNVASDDDPGVAEARADTSATATRGLEEIVVTATRRAERLQDIPVTVTAITSDTVRGAGVREVRELTQVVPAFTGGRSASVMQPVIRGVGSSGVSVGDESNVATYIDGVYQADPFSTSLDLVEVERVEVLRGPQGTVFGRNATGGLINIITPDPSFAFDGRMSARYGWLRTDANDYDVRAYVTGGISETLAADFAGLYRKTDGYIPNLFLGGYEGDIRLIDVRSKLLFAPSDSAEVVLSVQYGNQNSSLNAFQPYENKTSGRRFPGVILPTEPWQTVVNSRPQSDYERVNVALSTQFDLGSVNLETTSGFLHSDTDQLSDGDSSNFLLSELPFNTGVKTYSQEVRLLSNGGGRFNWLLGAYAFHLNGTMDVLLQNAASPAGPVSRTALSGRIKTTSFAGFAEGTYEIVDDIFVTAGARYTDETRKFRQRVNGVQLPSFGPDGTAEKSFNKFTYRGALRYHFADQANVFVSYGTGFKSGVFNAVGTSPLATDPETIEALEGGVKIDPTPWLRTNLSIYRYDYKDLQVNARDALGVTYILQNAANAEIYGGELEVTVSAAKDLNLRGAVAYNHGEYKDFPLAQTFVPRPDGGNTVVAQDVSGKRVIRSPRTTFNLGVDWGHDLAGGRLNLQGNLFHSGKLYYDFLNIFEQEAYTLASGEISWTTPDERWRFSLWAKNITNEAVAQQVKPGAPSTDIFYEAPRRVGIGVELGF